MAGKLIYNIAKKIELSNIQVGQEGVHLTLIDINNTRRPKQQTQPTRSLAEGIRFERTSHRQTKGKAT